MRPNCTVKHFQTYVCDTGRVRCKNFCCLVISCKKLFSVKCKNPVNSNAKLCLCMFTPTTFLFKYLQSKSCGFGVVLDLFFSLFRFALFLIINTHKKDLNPPLLFRKKRLFMPVNIWTCIEIQSCTGLSIALCSAEWHHHKRAPTFTKGSWKREDSKEKAQQLLRDDSHVKKQVTLKKCCTICDSE